MKFTIKISGWPYYTLIIYMIGIVILLVLTKASFINILLWPIYLLKFIFESILSIFAWS